ncbi:MAG: PilT/PilU family type 4a pilus ATPase [Candidatus Sedimenticola sp. 20ELBAFRAG]
MSTMNDFLRLMVEQNASDLFFSPGFPLHIKVDGHIQPVNDDPLPAEGVEQLANAMMDEEQRESFAKKPEMNLGLTLSGLGRFRVNIFRQRGAVAIVVRYLKDHIPSFDELNLPGILQELAMKKRGLVLMVGATGAGKSTSLASMIDFRNVNTRSHILTIEEPIEYLHHYKRSIVNQREIGIDTDCYADALKNAMREAPDVILIGEIRDRDTMQHAIAYAETGHLCLSTLHATNSNTALQRIVNFFPEVMHDSILMDLANNLEAIVSQRLVRGTEGRRMPAVEVLLASPYIRDLIRKGSIDEIREAMEKSTESGMQSFDQSLFDLHQRGLVSTDEAIAHAESVSNLNVMIRLSNGQR